MSSSPRGEERIWMNMFQFPIRNISKKHKASMKKEHWRCTLEIVVEKKASQRWQLTWVHQDWEGREAFLRGRRKEVRNTALWRAACAEQVPQAHRLGGRYGEGATEEFFWSNKMRLLFQKDPVIGCKMFGETIRDDRGNLGRRWLLLKQDGTGSN